MLINLHEMDFKMSRSQCDFSGPDVTAFRHEQEQVEGRSENREILALT